MPGKTPVRKMEPSRPAIFRIISGGQTGVDQAALDVARILGIPIGGFVPAGRWTAQGPLPTDYTGLEELGAGAEGQASDLALRTWMNVETADLTLIIEYDGVPSDEGTQATRAFVAQKDARHGRQGLTGASVPSSLIEARIGKPDDDAALQALRTELNRHLARLMRTRETLGSDPTPGVTLNIAGPRQEGSAIIAERGNIYADARSLLMDLLEPERRPFRVVAADRDKIVEHAFESLRHWDTIRWLSPFFFFTLAGGAVLGLESLLDDASFRLICIALATAGALSLLLIHKTVTYHRQQTRVLVNLGLDPGALPMLGFNWWRTATFWFRLVIAGVTVAFLLAGYAGRERTLEVLSGSPGAQETGIVPKDGTQPVVPDR